MKRFCPSLCLSEGNRSRFLILGEIEEGVAAGRRKETK
jgi:hypothetical protein